MTKHITNPTIENLVRAKSKIEHHWIQGSYAQTRLYHSCQPDDPQAECFCSLGAISAVTGQGVLAAHRTPEAGFLARAIGRKHQPLAILEFNDSATHEQVVKAFTKAISLARAAARKALKDTENALPNSSS